MKVTKLFFDKPAVCRAVDRTTRRVLSKIGSYVWRAAKSSIRKRERISQPGQPPSSHTGLLQRFIFFAYEPDDKTVVIGPVKLSKPVSNTTLPSLEHGGYSLRKKHGKIHRVSVRARPFMQPALQQELPKLPEMWRNAVR